MQKYNLRDLVEYDGKPFLPKVLVSQPGYRVVHLNIRAGQSVSDQVMNQMLTVYAVSGHITFYQNDAPADLKAGEVLWSGGNAALRLEAHEDSSLLVVAAETASEEAKELDLRTVERFQRHPLVFATFDALAVGEAFILTNDHDPVPLHRQMEAMRPEQLTWEYITRGPDIFRIRVRRIAPLRGSEVSPSAQPPQALWGIQQAR